MLNLVKETMNPSRVPSRSVGEGNVFTSVCLSTGGLPGCGVCMEESALRFLGVPTSDIKAEPSPDI